MVSGGAQRLPATLAPRSRRDCLAEQVRERKLSYEIGDGEGDEEYEYDLVDNPRMGVHPLTNFREDGFHSITEYEEGE